MQIVNSPVSFGKLTLFSMPAATEPEPFDDPYYAAFDDTYDDLDSDSELFESDHLNELPSWRTERIESILDALRAQGLNLELFLGALFWGDAECTSNARIAHERTVFMQSDTLEGILRRWWHPPTYKKDRAGGGKVMEDFVQECAGKMLEREMNDLSTWLRPPGDILSKEKLTSVNFRMVGNEIQTTRAPRLWSMLQHLAQSSRQEKENTVKNPFHVILTIISMLAYSRSHDSCLLTVVWTIYLKSCGLPARSFDALHALGITMSHKWASEAYATISRTEQATTQRLIQDRSKIGSHDNVNLPMRVFSQRLHNQSHFINATAATIYILPKSAFLPPDISQKVKTKRQEAFRSKPFTLDSDVLAEGDGDTRVEAQARWFTLKFLLDSPQFSKYPHRDNPLLAPPPPTDLLPCGPEHITEQRILETRQINESTYEGTDEFQVGLNSNSAKRKLGDQLTVERMRGLIRLRHDDPNSFARMEWVEPLFGWFHALMAFANSLHAQYLGTTAFETLGRKNLLKPETKGVFWQHLDEALWHVGEGNFLSLWATVSGVDDITELATWTPDELITLRDKIYDYHVSAAAQKKMDDLPTSERDEVKRQMAMFSADLLSYFNLRDAMRIGDVGRMEDLLPTMLLRFTGGGNHKYATEVTELLHKLHHEWPDELCEYVRKYCWLVNFTGARDGFLAIDMAQEHNIKDIKVTWRSFGPGATFPYIRKVSPAIPVLRAVKANVVSQFTTARARGTHHGTPSKDADVLQMFEMFQGFSAHARCPGRTIPGGSTNRAGDYVTLGATKLQVDGAIERWWNDRLFEKATTEIYSMDEHVNAMTSATVDTTT
ncbi:hypothetical protein C8Q78DRAFT_1098590 [Trametes maxima]|nr:hypothetical protein C8Q78DRAFT_1098590 [Trametes maxima]